MIVLTRFLKITTWNFLYFLRGSAICYNHPPTISQPEHLEILPGTLSSPYRAPLSEALNPKRLSYFKKYTIAWETINKDFIPKEDIKQTSKEWFLSPMDSCSFKRVNLTTLCSSCISQVVGPINHTLSFWRGHKTSAPVYFKSGVLFGYSADSEF